VSDTAEDAMLRRVAWRITLQTAALFLVSMLVLAGVAGVLIVRTQTSDSQRLLRQAVADTDAVTDPPSGTLVYESDRNGAVRSSPELNGSPLDQRALDTVRVNGSTVTGTGRRNGREYLLRTAPRGSTTVQAALDLSPQEAERRRLLNSLIVVGAVGVVLALAVGRLIAHRAIRPLGAAFARQRRFIADASHELRTPLTQIHTRAQLIERGLRSLQQPRLADDAQQLVRGTRQLGDIVDEMLVSAQLRADPERLEPVDLGGIAAEVVEADRARAIAHGVTLSLNEGPGPLDVAGSATALRRVIGSLVDNALGHTPPGGHVTVDMDYVSERNQVRCSVRDDGVGLDAATAESLFERFARGGHGSGRRYGLGLALVREVVEAHHGTVTAGGAVGLGATFTVTLPARTGEPSRGG
jgi:two-component system OmpR family sensor kinase